MTTKQTDPADKNACTEAPAPAENAPPRFCSSCSRTKPAAGGRLVLCANGAKRWKCADCIARSKAHQAARQAQPPTPGQDSGE